LINRVTGLIFLKGYSIIEGSIILDREVVREFLEEELRETEIPVIFSKKHL